jgi:predicted membrane channel-forming protein YqfA (hemolysin III family)
MMHGYGMMEYMNTMGPWMWILMILFWTFAIFGLICTFRWLFGHLWHSKD